MSDDAQVVAFDDGYMEWTGDEMHAYFSAVGINAVVADARITDALNADFRDLVMRSIGDDEEAPAELAIPAGWQPLNLLGLDPLYLLGFAWIPARRERPDLSFEDFNREVKAGALLDAYIDSVLERIPHAEEAEQASEEEAAPLASPTKSKTSQRSRTKSSSRTASSSRSGKSGRSSTTSSNA